MSVIKRLGSKGMRLGEAAGRKVLWVWDRAVIDFPLWQHWMFNDNLFSTLTTV